MTEITGPRGGITATNDPDFYDSKTANEVLVKELALPADPQERKALIDFIVATAAKDGRDQILIDLPPKDGLARMALVWADELANMPAKGDSIQLNGEQGMVVFVDDDDEEAEPRTTGANALQAVLYMYAGACLVAPEPLVTKVAAAGLAAFAAYAVGEQKTEMVAEAEVHKERDGQPSKLLEGLDAPRTSGPLEKKPQ